jgi:CO dehydrogenase/acetyl-CoA synthase gamma subunit (corrinoid Fe-S protein)
MAMHLKIFDLLPQTDCRKCGRNTCLVFATEVAQRQTCVEACPDISDEAERALRRIVAAEHEMISWLGGMISGISKSNLKGALVMFREIFVLFPVRVVSLLLFTFPLTYPFLAAALWLYNR